MKKLFIAIILFLGVCYNSTAQKKSNKELQGDKYAFVYSFDKAIEAYTHSKKLTIGGQRMLAMSYHNINLNNQSESIYAKLIKSDTTILAIDYYNYSMVLRANGKYADANKEMDKFKELKPFDLRLKSHASNNNGLTNLLIDDGKYQIEHLNLNTDAEDFGTSYYKDKIIFSSSRTKTKTNEKNYNWNGKPFLDMYISEMDGNQLMPPTVFDKSLNSKMHDGTASFNKEGTFVAFTCNDHIEKKKDNVVGLQICFSTYKDGKWSAHEQFPLNNQAYSVGHPFLTADGNTMYFTSDMPGGYGGADIYKIKKGEDGVWNKQENLGNKINTEGLEMFPFFEENNGILLFTSDGHFGLGGLDIFMVATNGSAYGRVYNAGVPLNTQYDDFAVIVNGTTNKGYFSSNRFGGSGDDDIYSVDFLKGLNAGKKLIGIAKDKYGNAISKTFIKLFDGKGNLVDTLTTGDDAAYSFLVDSDKNYKLVGSKEKYNDGDTLVNTSGKEFIIKADVTLRVPIKKEEIIAQQIVIGADLGKILELNSIYFDLNKFKIRPDAEIELDKIVKIMNEYPTMVVELGSHTDCRNTKKYNQKLSEKRAKSSAEYIKQKIYKPGRVYGRGYGETKVKLFQNALMMNIKKTDAPNLLLCKSNFTDLTF